MRWSMVCLILLGCTVHANELWAQQDSCSWTLVGKVVDEHDGTQLSFAEVYIPELGRGVVCDADGLFRLSNTSPVKLSLS